ncbi:MAG: acyl-CoA/acyl-ACP dehydrogenase [Xanthobacteraceae bacterium]|nr:acyl-CoA/acyl-ACP dehydrogenase [Xanthobacteraceae bacterium]
MTQAAVQLAVSNDATPTVRGVVTGALRPLVRRIDEEGFYPAAVMHELGAAGAFRQHADGASGDHGLFAAIEAMAEVSAACISTGFCVWCQDALVWYLANAENPRARERYLDEVAQGRQLGGTGLSNPMKALSGIEPLALRGVRVPGGYRITGRLPFVSNVEPGHLFAGVFRIEGSERLGMAVFRAGHEHVTLVRSAHFIALEGSATYSVQIRDAFVPDDDVLSEDAATFVTNIRKGFVLLQAGIGLGAARGAARSMGADAIGRRLGANLPLGPDEIDARCDALAAQVQTLARDPQPTDRAAFLEVLRARLAISWLALEAAQAAMLQSGARGYLAGSEPARRLREAQFVALVTPSVKHIVAELAKG